MENNSGNVSKERKGMKERGKQWNYSTELGLRPLNLICAFNKKGVIQKRNYAMTMAEIRGVECGAERIF